MMSASIYSAYSQFIHYLAMVNNQGPKTSNSNLSSSFNSGLDKFGLNNSYGNAPPPAATNGSNGGYTSGNSGASSLNNSPQFNSPNNGLMQKKELPAWLQGLSYTYTCHQNVWSGWPVYEVKFQNKFFEM